VSEPFDEVLEPQEDEGLHHDRRVHGGMPLREDDDALERLVEEDRVAAGVSDYAEDDVPPATDAPPPGTSEAVTLAQQGLIGDTTVRDDQG
jgi:hypothetical protein